MNSSNRVIKVGGIPVREGTSLYDTDHDRVLWVSGIKDETVTVEPVTGYEVDRSIGMTHGDQTRMIAEDTVLSILEFKSLIRSGRFDVSP